MSQPSPITSGMQRLWGDSTPAVRVIALVNIVVFAIPALADFVGFRLLGISLTDLLLMWGAKDNIAIAAGDQYYRFFTMMFLHGGLLHLLFNTIALTSFGSEIERIAGTQRFLGIYFVGGLMGGVASYIFSPNPAVGASGAIFALIGAEIVFIWLNRAVFGERAKQMLGSVGFTALANIGIGFSVPNIDNMAHIGGLIGGLLCGFCVMPLLMTIESDMGPVRIRQSRPWGWYGVVAVTIVLIVVVMVVVPAVDLG
ncbi:MAG: rhomboid family intramembrane serine protease [Chloroflexi bacterium]|nr:MAG: rhomboid family intramembrane serine protease [Chloroflexota bacterium]